MFFIVDCLKLRSVFWLLIKVFIKVGVFLEIVDFCVGVSFLKKVICLVWFVVWLEIIFVVLFVLVIVLFVIWLILKLKVLFIYCFFCFVLFLG